MTDDPVADLVAVRQKIAKIISEDWADFVGVGPSELATADRILAALTPTSAEPVAVAVRHSFDGYGWQYADQGDGSDWLARALAKPDAQPLRALTGEKS
ncbi:hypothetical protein SAMN04489859_100878 [Paracoccus alcaliphilus]|uniref:Uncharacterized protein n=1 Tax=Paracoccus alcaliphilus TaxID=34002 RepID=A0A1H8H3Z4_9RHOB|nr:hypothetical protein [Paracoccus alcaliphilus]WCR17415.1 hypothetical protein JHW40_13840 [Paracoccus alcaliphilus]SEN50208.1 hypothetical protein SAMN04489859_100878 [Paracoccus alcaliphilus]